MMIGIIRKGVLWVSRKLDLVVHLTAEKLVLRQQLLVLKRAHRDRHVTEGMHAPASSRCFLRAGAATLVLGPEASRTRR